MRSAFILFSISLFSLQSLAQSAFGSLGEDYWRLAERYEIKGGQNWEGWHTGFRNLRRRELMLQIDSLDWQNMQLSRRDYFNLGYFQTDNPEYTRSDKRNLKPWLNFFYGQKNALYSYRGKDFQVFVNPVLGFFGGSDIQTGGHFITQNTRGAEIRGLIDNKIAFYTQVTDNQIQVPQYVQQWSDSLGKVIPGAGFVKNFKNRPYAFDFFDARGYISFPVTKHVGVQFGHDRNFIGHGMRSLVLSDFARDYLHLKISTTVWKIHYQNIFSEFTDFRSMTGSGAGVRRKYGAMHILSTNIGKKVQLGFFENIVFGRQDTTAPQSFELNYLNPVIFYRAVEHNLDSRDNVLLGTYLRWLLGKNLSLYGQLVLDEFKLSEIRAMNGWWANKYAFQLGMRYLDVARISNLDLQLEFNYVRPFTYTHAYLEGNYITYGQALAHPLGANFTEGMVDITYQPMRRLTLRSRSFYALKGLDSLLNGPNYGGNINRTYRDRALAYGNKTGQGFAQHIFFTTFTATWMAAHNLFVDFNLTYRQWNRLENGASVNYQNTILGFGLRLNLARRVAEF